MNGEYPYCGTGSFTDELKRAAFEAKTAVMITETG